MKIIISCSYNTRYDCIETVKYAALLLVCAELSLSTKACQTVKRSHSLTDIHNMVKVWVERRVWGLEASWSFWNSRWGLNLGWLLCGSCLPCLGPEESQHWPSNALIILSVQLRWHRTFKYRDRFKHWSRKAAWLKMYQEEGQLILAS